MSKTDIIYLALPAVLWPIVFIGLTGVFVYAMLFAAAGLALFTISKYRNYIKLKDYSGYPKLIVFGVAGSIALYLVFLGGYYLTVLLGINGYVSSIYFMLYSQGSRLVIAPILVLIGTSEEIYWRGGVQGYLRKNSKFFKNAPWFGSTLLYAGVHLLTLNPVLAFAAFFVGLITGLIAERYGIFASSIAHVVWLEAVVLFIPIGATLIH